MRLPRRLGLLVQLDRQERLEGLARRAPRGCRARQDLRGHLELMARKGRKESPGYKVLSVQRVPTGHKVRKDCLARRALLVLKELREASAHRAQLALRVYLASWDRKVQPGYKVQRARSVPLDLLAFVPDAAGRHRLRHLRPQSGAYALQHRPGCPRWPACQA